LLLLLVGDDVQPRQHAVVRHVHGWLRCDWWVKGSRLGGRDL
jgi:hypothetical protein